MTATSPIGDQVPVDGSPALATTSGESSADPRRLARSLDRFAAMSLTDVGVTRLAYTSLERDAHAVFAEAMAALGCQVTTDPAGNTVATRAGRHPGPAVATGSHLDSVYLGGRFDGIAGVVAAMEVARLLETDHVETHHPLRFVAFAGEEGARFGQACIGSKLAAGLSSLEELQRRRDTDGVSIAEAMEKVGFDPSEAATSRWAPSEWAAFIELHVEQGNVLERTGSDVAIVDLISGSTRLEFAIDGRASHTGGTPMEGRADALVAAAEGVLIAESLALDARHRGARATVGRLDVHPGSITTIPGRVKFSLDVRDVDADRQRKTAAEIVRRLHATCQRRGVRLTVGLLADTSPVVLPTWVRGVIAAAAGQAGFSYRVLTSGASHDAQMINRIVPSGMIFVPSRTGLSHVPEEWTSPRDLAIGVDLLRRTMILLDQQIASADTQADERAEIDSLTGEDAT